MACGGAGMVVIDIDAHRTPVPHRDALLPGITIPAQVRLDGLASGFDTLALLAAYRGHTSPAEDTHTLRVRTPSGGLHVWYRSPDPSVRYRCSTGSARHTALAWQVDVRADGGYIVAPGTRTAQGVYRAEGTVRRPAPLPDWLRDELRRTGHVIRPQSRSVATSAPGDGRTASDGLTSDDGPTSDDRRSTLPKRGRPRAASSSGERLVDPLIAIVAECAAVAEGAGFSEKLNRAAYTAGGLVGAGRLDHAYIRDRLVRVAHYARPRQQSRNEKIVDDALATGAVRPLPIEGRP